MCHGLGVHDVVVEGLPGPIRPADAATPGIHRNHLFELPEVDEGAVQCARYIGLESIAPISDDPVDSLPAMAG